MTVPSTTRKAGPYAGNGVATSFPFVFKVFAKTDVSVILTDSNGSATTLLLDSDYSVTLNADQDANPGGSITYPALVGPAPLPAGSTLTMIGGLEASQDTDLTNGGRYLPDVIEAAFDKLTILVQQLKEVSSRTLQAAVGTTVSLIFPAPSSGKFIRWRSDLLGLENVDAGTDSTVLQGLLADASDVTHGSALIGYRPNVAGAPVGRTLSSKLLDILSVKDFGAIGDGVVDDTAAIQAAITAAGNRAAGGTVFFPDGKYKITSTLTVSKSNVSLLGSSQYSAKIIRSSAFGTALYVGTGTSAPLSNFSLASLQFVDSGTNNQSGVQITMEIVTVATVKDIFINGATSGIICKAVANAEFRNVYMTMINPAGSSTNNFGIQFTNTAIASPAFGSSSNVYLTDCSIYGGDFGGTFSNLDDCLRIDSMDGLWVNGCYFRGSNNAGVHLLRNSASYPLVNVFMVNNMLDIVHSWGILIDGSQTCNQLTLNNIIIGNGAVGKDGIKITGPVDKVLISGMVGLWGGNGITIGAPAIPMTNITISCLTSTGNTGYGLSLTNDVALNNIIASGNNFTGNGDSVQDASPSTITKYLEGNLGFDTPWISYTPVIASNGGAITAVAAGSYKKVGKRVYLSIRITSVSADTGTGYVTFTLPPLGNPAQNAALSALEATTNVTCTAKLQSSLSTGALMKYDGSYPSAVGRVFYITGTYEV